MSCDASFVAAEEDDREQARDVAQPEPSCEEVSQGHGWDYDTCIPEWVQGDACCMRLLVAAHC